MEEKLYEIKENDVVREATQLPTFLDPQTNDLLLRKIAIPYTTTEPTYTAPYDGYRTMYYDGSNYWLYVYSNTGWRKLQFTGLTFPTSDPNADRILFWDDSAGVFTYLSLGSGLSISGTTLSLSSSDQVVENYTKADSSIAVGDVVSLLEGGSIDFWKQDDYVEDAEVGKQTNPNKAAVKFIAPIAITGFTATISIKESGSSSSDVDVKLCSDSSGPGSTIETQTISNTSITGSYQDISVSFTSALTPGITYWIIVEKQGAVDSANYYLVKTAGTFQFYSAGGVYTGASWTTNEKPMVITLNKTITAGLYRSIDVPNNLGIQGSIKGIAKTVNSGDVDVVISGKYQSSGTPYTAGNDYYLSATTAGGISTTGQCQLGRAVSTSVLDTFSHKQVHIRYVGTIDFLTSPITVTIMTGIRAKLIECQASESSQYSSIGNYYAGSSSARCIKWRNGVEPAQQGRLWDTESTGGGSSGSYSGTPTINKSNISIQITSTALTKSFIGNLDFIY